MAALQNLLPAANLTHYAWPRKILAIVLAFCTRKILEGMPNFAFVFDHIDNAA